MSRFRWFVTAPLGDKIRLATATGLLVVLPVCLVVFSFSGLRTVLVRVSGFAARGVPDNPAPARLVRTVDIADRHFPGDRTCLVRSLSAETLLRLYGHRPEHKIGVMRDDGDGIRAHSWLEMNDQILLGEVENLSEYNQLPSLDHEGEL